MRGTWVVVLVAVVLAACARRRGTPPTELAFSVEALGCDAVARDAPCEITPDQTIRVAVQGASSGVPFDVRASMAEDCALLSEPSAHDRPASRGLAATEHARVIVPAGARSLCVTAHDESRTGT